MQKESFSMEETYKIGYEYGKNAKACEVYCLEGDLGVGKTVFAKGFAKGLDIDDEITSPTFTIVNEYEGRLLFYHFDMYRIEEQDEVLNIGFDDYIFGEGVCLIEWPKRVSDYLPDNIISIEIFKDLTKGEDYRYIKVTR
ncbi:MAG: tRNA (adenosine(37)-N6)-threonylcarbamoyltransferase complex ATPase subunit type 1 TsaE [Lachnospirales bacterium]